MVVGFLLFGVFGFLEGGMEYYENVYWGFILVWGS